MDTAAASDKAAAVIRDEGTKRGPLDRVIDFLTIEPNEKRVASDPERYYPSKIVFSPYVIYSPETSFGFGIGGSYLFKFPGSGDEERTRTSAIPLAFTYTLENQVLFYSGFEVFWPDEEWVLSGNFRGSIFPRLFYGIGPRTPDYGAEAFGENDIVFQSREIVLEPILSKQLFVDRLFLGAGARYRRVGATSFEYLEEGEVPEGGEALLREFRGLDGGGGSTSIGVEAAGLYDTRNSLLNAQRGSYFELTYGKYFAGVLGGDSEYDLLRADARRFFQLGGDEDHRDVLGVQGVGYFATGEVPLVELGQLGSGEIMRGYYEGRYTDRSYVATQAEYLEILQQSA